MRNWMNLPAAIILLISAVSKLIQLGLEPASPNLLFQTPLVHVLVICLELFFFSWLLSGVLSRVCRLATISLFSIFFAYLLVQLIIGEDNCGCFGSLTLPIKYMLFLDATLLCSLGLWTPNPPKPSNFLKKTSAGMVGSVLMLATWIVFFGLPPIEKSVLGDISGDGSTIFLRADRWIGKEFPLIEFLDNEVALSGKKKLVIVKGDCPGCIELVDSLIAANTGNIVYIEIPPKSSGYSERVENWYALSEGVRWFCKVPVILESENGVVTKVFNFDKTQGQF